MTNVRVVNNDIPSVINELCRLCLSKDSGILPIFAEEESGNSSVPLSFRILACVSIEVSVNDGLPKHICRNCLSQVNTWHTFKQVCDSSQITLKEWLSKLEQDLSVQDKTVSVKQEPPDEDDMIEIHHNVDSGEILEDLNHEIEIEHHNLDAEQTSDLDSRRDSGLLPDMGHSENLNLSDDLDSRQDSSLHLQIESQGNATEIHERGTAEQHESSLEASSEMVHDVEMVTALGIHNQNIMRSNDIHHSLESNDNSGTPQEIQMNDDDEDYVEAITLDVGIRRSGDVQHDIESRGNTDHFEIKQEEIEVCEIIEEEEEEDHFNVEVVDDPLSITQIEAEKPLPVRCIKIEPLEDVQVEEQYGVESFKRKDAAVCYDAVNRIYSDLKVMKSEHSMTKKKPKKKRPLTLRKKRPSVQVDTRPLPVEHTVVSGSKQKYFCFPAANGKEHYFCIPCGKTFKWKSYYLRHEKTHRKTRHVCGLCDRHFSCKSNLDRHIRLHTGLQPLTCQNCSVHFQSKSEYMKHKFQCMPNATKAESPKFEPPKPEPLKSESHDVPVSKDSNVGDSFPCYICRETFDSINKLQIHRRSHDDFRCRKCNKSFKGGIALSNHLRTHNFDGFKRYSCKICKKNFSNVTSLVSHKRFHTIKQNAAMGRIGSRSAAAKLLMFGGSKPQNTTARATSNTPAPKPPLKNNTTMPKPPSKITQRPLKQNSLVPKSQNKHLNVGHAAVPGQGYCCTVCRKWVKTLSVLKRHMTSHTKLKLFSCFVCKLSMGYASSLHKHMRLAHDIELSYSEIHAMTKIPPLQEQEAFMEGHASKTVGKGKKTDKVVQRMVIHDHQDEESIFEGSQSLSKLGFTCNTCFKTFSNKRLLENHMKIIHMGGRAYKCNTCSKLFAYKHLLVKHAKLHAVESQGYNCTVCSKTFTDLKTLNNHAKLHTVETQGFKCAVCLKTFADLKTLNNHKGVHTRFKCYSCKTCSKSFNGLKNWEQHQRLHASTIRFRCRMCGKTFFSKSELYEHKKMHIKLKIYTCGECKNSYNSMSALNRHKRKKHDNTDPEIDSFVGESDDENELMDEEERLYVCGVCDRTFPDTVSLSKHKLIHIKRDFSKVHAPVVIDPPATKSVSATTNPTNAGGKFECLLCQRDFPDQSSLSKHRAWHAKKVSESDSNFPLKGKKIYVCGFCKRSFANSGSLSKHRKLNCPPKRNYNKNLIPGAFLQNPILQSVKSVNVGSMILPKVNSVKPSIKPSKPSIKPLKPSIKPLKPSIKSSVKPSVKPKSTPVSNVAKTERSRHFPCLLCERVFTNKKALVRHKGWHTRCPTLGKETPSAASKTVAVMEAPATESETVADQETPSAVTENTPEENEAEVIIADEEEEKEEEKVQEDPIPPPQQQQQEVPPPKSQRRPNPKNRTCDVCFKVYSSSSTLSRHKRLHTRKLLTNLKIIRKPQTLPPPKPIVVQRTEEDSATSIAKGDCIHSCRYCRKMFKFKRHLIDHERVHTGERPFSCNQCSLSFSRRAILWRHQKTHSGIRPFACTLCPKAFLFNFQLTRHVADKHVDKDIYTCQHCDKSYRTSLALQKHKLSHQM